MDNIFFAGIDIGSTTAKVIILDGNDRVVFSRYRRHQARTVETARAIFREAVEELGDVRLDLAVTGSAGMGVAEAFGLPFVQEVVASASLIEKKFPDVRTFIELGGEDSKIVFFDESFRPEIRMNGSCAGGTGAFIDQMAVLLDVEVAELDSLAAKSTNTYPIASRCGVFAKTDIQALLSRHVSREDIAASVFHSVALQVITALARGRNIEKKILFGGGPLTFYANLRKAFANLLSIKNPEDMIIPRHSELLAAMGAAITRNQEPCRVRISRIMSVPGNSGKQKIKTGTKRLSALFESESWFRTWQKRHEQARVPKINPVMAKGKNLFLGIDSGSTTTKIVLIDEDGNLVLGHYGSNNGDPIRAVKDGLAALRGKMAREEFPFRIARTAATGYGEGLVRAAFGLDDGVVETMAHYRAARHFEPDVSFILDIGGQDMKAITIRNHAVAEIQVNEACSSGCGSFIETFARSLGYPVQDFARMACVSKSPFDLGTRCTVFMNSKVKQALREGATIPDISAGLAYSVIKNALYKVLKLKDTGVLGNKIIAQGGTFRNPAVLRALELLLGRDVVKPDIPELMGAYGAALTALSNFRSKEAGRNASFKCIENLESGTDFSRKEIRCNGCENRCTVLKLSFGNGNYFYTGNRCERHFSNNPDKARRGRNLIREQVRLLFDRNMEPEGGPLLTFGIPRCLNMYEDFPFWCALLTSCGFRVVLSPASDFKLYEKGAPTIMSENICFPAKLVHGHVLDLIKKGVDRIFYPTVVYEQREYDNALNTFNCPVVTGYPDLIKSAVAPLKEYGIPLDNPAVSFKRTDLLKEQLCLFFRQFGIGRKRVSAGVEKGLAAQREYKQRLRELAGGLVARAEDEGRTVVVLAGRPYHTDRLVNHGVPNLLTEMGVDVISENAVPLEPGITHIEDVDVLTQWSYTNRLYVAAGWVTRTPCAQLVQLTSFGCGPDAISSDEVGRILGNGGKIHTLIKMDEIANLGAVKIRLRSMLEAVRENAGGGNNMARRARASRPTRLFMRADRKRTLIAPYFSPFYSPLLPAAFRPLGYNVDILPPQDNISVELGLKTINNDMCYPSILVAGDIIKAFRSGRYDPEKTAVILTQTGGQCRASSYVSLVRKGLATAGLDNVPVIALSDEEITQPGFEIDEKGLVKRLALGIIFADPLARMYLATVARERVPGTSRALHIKYLSEMEPGIEQADYHYLFNLLKKAVEDFNSIETRQGPVPRIGVVGEIFVKYNFFCNSDIIHWLSGQEVEVILPPLQSFFTQRFINETYDQKARFKRCLVDRVKFWLLDMYTKHYLGQIERVMQGFRFYRKSHDLRKLAEMTAEVISLANQYGEGWLLTADMIAMLNEGIGNIVCLQPFGCISNHITGRGMEKKLKEIYPHLNLLSLDMDSGASEVNILNRLHFMVTAARHQAGLEPERGSGQGADRRFAIAIKWPREFHALNNYVSLDVEKWKTWVSFLGLRERARHIKLGMGTYRKKGNPFRRS